jgi:hypothetical protein
MAADLGQPPVGVDNTPSTPVLGDLHQRFAATLIKQEKHEPSAVAGPSAGRAWA